MKVEKLEDPNFPSRSSFNTYRTIRKYAKTPLTVIGPENEPSFQNGGSMSWNCGYYYLGFDQGFPYLKPTSTVDPWAAGPAPTST